MNVKINLYNRAALMLLFVFWITPGLFHREPWKADEPYSFGIVNDMIQTGDLVVPRLTGEPFLEKPTLFYATAAFFGKLFSPPLELYDAARLATAAYMLIAVVFFALTAKKLYGDEYGGSAVFLLVGCLGLQEFAHKLITDVGLFAGFSVALYGFALCGRKRTAGGFWIGTGAGIGFMTKGLLAPGVLVVTAILLPVIFRAWRQKSYGHTLAVALAAALPWLIIWPAALFRRSPDFFVHWFWRENFGRFLGHNFGGTVGFDESIAPSHSYYLTNLLWFAWPAVLPAAWSLWNYRKSRAEHPVFQMPLVAFIVMFVTLSASATSRSLYALPMLLPVSLMALPGIELLPARVKTIGSRFSVLLFGAIALLLWCGWLVMLTGSPSVIAQKIHDFQPDYVPAVDAVLFAAAVFYSLTWLLLVILMTRWQDHLVANWTLGLVLCWGLIMTLWLPALNSGSSYRAVFTDLKQNMPMKYSCVASKGLGESERAMLEYFTGLKTRRIELTGGTGDCDLLLEEHGGNDEPTGVKGQRIWQYRHPSVHPKNFFALYRLPSTIDKRSDRTSSAP
jgi:4-amino-4-deoxy-L-arabinose transferase-like glycosyltransferase